MGVQDDEAVGLDGLRVEFDDERLVGDADVALVATLAQRLGIEPLAARLVALRGDRPGAANAGRKVMAVLFAMVLGADSIDDTGVLRAGRTRRLLGGWIPAPSTLGTFLRAFTFGHVRQLDRLLAESLTRAWKAGAGPGDGRLVIDVDSFVGEVCGYQKQGAAYGYTRVFGYHPILATRADTREALHIRLRKGSANTQKGIKRFCEELIAQPRSPCPAGRSQRLDLGFSHAFINGVRTSPLVIDDASAAREPRRRQRTTRRRHPPSAPRKGLLMLRHKLPALAIGNHHGVEDAPENIFACCASRGTQRLFITLDFAAEERLVALLAST